MPEEKKDSEMEEEKQEDETSEISEDEISEETKESGDTQELERVKVALKKANAEAAERRKKLEKYEKEEKARQEAELSELQKVQKQLAEAQTQYEDLQLTLQTERIKSSILNEANKLSFDNPEDAYLILDLSDVQVEDGKVTGFEKQLKALAESGRLKMRGQQPPDIDADKKGKKQKQADDDAIMRRFGL